MRYFIGFLVTVGLLIVLILLLFTGGHGNNKKPRPHVKLLPDYSSTDVTVRLSIDGKINADQNHNAVRITVGQSNVTYEHIQGYEGTVVDEQTFANNQNAYNNFLFALMRAGYTNGNNDSNLVGAEKGRCALYRRYVFETIDGNGQDITRYWATDCGKPRTYNGNLYQTIQLFQLQVPNYPNITQGIQF